MCFNMTNTLIETHKVKIVFNRIGGLSRIQMKSSSTNMWLRHWRRPKVLIGILLIFIIVCVLTTRSHWMDSKGSQNGLIFLKEKDEGLKENTEPTVITTLAQTTHTSRLVIIDPTTVPPKTVEPEKGLYNYTVVTALVDIGRGKWKKLTRSYETYLSYLEQLLKLEANMVIYIEPKGAASVEKMRRGKENHTKIIIINLVDLPYYRYRSRMAEIMATEEYKKDNQLVKNELCEATIPEYDIITLSKLYFINRTVWENPFSTSYFMWLDGGYGHGHNIYPKNFVWIPKNLFEFSDKVTLIERSPGVKHFENQIKRIHKLNINILAGGFVAGGTDALKELCEMQRVLVDEWMKIGIVDDDQTALMWVYYRKPSLFHLVAADWYDVFKVFNKNTTETILKT